MQFRLKTQAHLGLSIFQVPYMFLFA
uniref:Uncharacterized protein n=1 Tax=Anguilla anguilla TaxID=7936 RepID=A0A0E9QRI4_ANGAN